MTDSVRRVVTGTLDGRSRIVSDGDARAYRFASVPGMRTAMYWAADGSDPGPSGADPVPTLVHDLPGPGGSRFLVIVFPPDSTYEADGFDPAAAAAETRQVSPDVAGHLQAGGGGGWHTTPTLDYISVMAGEVDLEVDEGEPVRLHVGDVVVQNGTRHRWRNPTGEPATLHVVHLGWNVAVAAG